MGAGRRREIKVEKIKDKIGIIFDSTGTISIQTTLENSVDVVIYMCLAMAQVQFNEPEKERVKKILAQMQVMG